MAKRKRAKVAKPEPKLWATSTKEGRALHKQLQGPMPPIFHDEQYLRIRDAFSIAEKQRDDALKALLSRANIGQTIKRLDEVLAAVEMTVKRLQAIARNFDVGDD
jgi:hypothetical protein